MEVYVVKVVYVRYHMGFSTHQDDCDVKVFSSREKAEKFLVQNFFLYGLSCYFTKPGWYHKGSINRKWGDVPGLIYAEIECVMIDAEHDSYWHKCTDFLIGSNKE